ncbi:phage tail fiber assembly protein [Edwardsiella tarda]
MNNAIIDVDGIATVAGNIKVYNYDGHTREYLSTSDEFLVVGVGVPAHSCVDAIPIAKTGFAICRTEDLKRWEYVEDHRGEIIYDTETGDAIKVTAIGEYQPGTTIAPATPYDKWNGNAWITDAVAQHAAYIAHAEVKKSELLAEAQATISLWQTELQLGIISNEDKDKLVAWMKYIQAINIIDTSLAPDITWPIKPE